MDSLEDSLKDLFPEERDTIEARKALLELFPEEAEELKEKRADEIYERIKPKIDASLTELTKAVDEEIGAIHELIEDTNEKSDVSRQTLSDKLESLETKVKDIQKLQYAISRLTDALKEHKTDVSQQIEKSNKTSKELSYRAIGLVNDLKEKLLVVKERVELAHDRIDEWEPYDDEDVKKSISALEETVSRLPKGGGNMNRNIAVGGNSSVLSRYTDINIKAGANVTLSYTNNDTSKYLDLTIAATGGGGGTTRSINSISTSQTAGSTSGTDYVYVCSAGINLTLPDATANTNLYTVKNTSASSVLVSTTSAQTIDGQSNLILATQYTAVDLISDGSNWDIT